MAGIGKFFTDRTLHRQALKRVDTMLDCALAESSSNCLESGCDSVVVEDGDVSGHYEHKHSSDSEACEENDQESDTDDSIDNHDDATLPCYTFSSNEISLVDSDREVSDESDMSVSREAESLRDKLADWAVRSGIPLCHTNSLLTILRPHFPELPKDARTLVGTPTSYDVCDVAGGKCYYFGIKSNITVILDTRKELAALDTLSLQVNIDGLPLFKSSNDQFWPILGLLREDKTNQPFVIGLWVGSSKPEDSNLYLHSFIDEMKKIQTEGMAYKGSVKKIKLLNFVCDTPARAFVKKSKGHTGYSGCDKCNQTGEWINHRMTFPEVRATSRTDVMFDEMVDEEHHRGESTLRQLNIGLVSGFPLDYMHLVCLGVVRKLIFLWMKGPLPTRIGCRIVHLISESIVGFKPFMPREFARKGRSLSEVDRWKATEFRNFVLYTGPVALKRKLSHELFSHFIMLHVSITILSSSQLCSQYCDYVEDLLILFVQHFGAVFGHDQLVYNVHALTHLVSDVRRFGPIQNFAGFPFENYLQVIKRLLRKPGCPLEQVVRRLTERRNIVFQSESCIRGCKKEHFRGPLPTNFPLCTQFEELHSENAIISLKQGDNAILVNENVLIVKNIVVVNDAVQLLCQKFAVKEMFFEYPLSSLLLNIAFVKTLKADVVTVGASDISSKVVLLPYTDGFVAFPLLHTS